MNSIAIVVSASSRLLADIILIRLRRAGIDCKKISALFPTRSAPNTVGCWLPVAQGPGIRLGDETIDCAGPLRKDPARTGGPADIPYGIVELLTRAGVEAMGAHILVEQLEQGRILLCVHATNEVEASIAWHVFHHSGAEPIVMGSMLSHGVRREPHHVLPRAPVAA